MGQVMPAAYILLGGKKTTTYIRMIKELKLAVESIGLTFLPEFICLDFEAGAIKYPHFQKFLLYLIETWIGDEDDKTVPLFDRKLWNHWDTDLKTRTNIE